MKLANYGRREWMGSGCIALLLCAVLALTVLRWDATTGILLITIVGLLWLAIAAFFRVPHRRIPSDDTVLVAPADGLVKDIDVTKHHGIEHFEGQELVRIGIFLSVLDVHVNRAPCSFQIEDKQYKEGRFLDARDPRCAKENESMVIAGVGSAGGRSFPTAVRQISGAIARRIVCEVNRGDSLEKGDIYGMIKFGSRTELYLPAEPWMKITVAVGDKIRSGTTVVAKVTITSII